MKSPPAPLTDTDRRLAAQLEALYGPVQKPAPPRPESAERSPRRKRPLGGLLARTVVLLAIAYALVTFSEPGRAMYEAISVGVRSGYEALLSGTPFR